MRGLYAGAWKERKIASMIFSVIVPFLNEERYIECCIKSLLRQDFDVRERELIFVDNGSTDGSAEIVRRYPEITMLREPLPNVYAARNKALAIARGEIIAFTDADCEVAPDWLSQIGWGIKETGAAIVLGKRLFSPRCSVTAQILQDYENAKSEYLLTQSMAKYYFGFTNNMAVTAHCFKEVGVFEDKLKRHADTELVQRCVLKCPRSKIVYLSDMKIVHLEIVSVWAWLAKLYIYGMHNRDVKELQSYYQELGLKERREVFEHLVRTYHYSFLKSLWATFVLMGGSFFYAAGQVFRFFCDLFAAKGKPLWK